MAVARYLTPIVLTLIIFFVAGAGYVFLWNVAVNYNLIPSQNQNVSGQVSFTTTMLTTSTIQTSTTVFNQTFTGLECPGGAVSCTGVADQVAVVVNHPLIDFAGLRFAEIPSYDTAISPYSLFFYHDLFFTSLATLCAVWCAAQLIAEKRKQDYARFMLIMKRRRMMLLAQQRKTQGAKTQ